MSPPHVLSAVAVATAAFYLSFILLPADAARLRPPLAARLTPTLAAAANNLITQRRSFINEFLQAHNKYRSSFNIPPLIWDRNLTRYARRWGDKRAGDCKMVHSMGPYGENLFWGKLEHWTPAEVVQSWAEENKFYNLNSNVCVAGQMCGHYTQIIWKESLRLGCARVNCLNGELLVICEYDPPGNYVNEKPL